MTGLATQTITKTRSLTILQRIANKDRTAVKDCIDTYGNFIWALARKLIASTKEAELAKQEIFIDIWQFAERGDKTHFAENILIALIGKTPAMSQTKSMEGYR